MIKYVRHDLIALGSADGLKKGRICVFNEGNDIAATVKTAT
jgi:hypothetical protein